MSQISDAYGQRKKHNVMADTWGHTFPKPGKYPATIFIAVSALGEEMIVDYQSPLCDSPQLHALVHSALDIYDFRSTHSGGLYSLDCTLWFFKTCGDMYLGKPVGKIVKPKLELLLGLPTHPTDHVLKNISN